MKWKGRRKSSNVEDRRGSSTGGKIAVGGGIIGLIFLAIQLFSGGDATEVLQQLDQQNSYSESRELTAEEEELGNFAATVLADTENVWNRIFSENNMQYEEPGMVLYDNRTRSGCGTAASAMGPFYCPQDQKVYMDLDFFKELRQRFGAKDGNFAIAYVIAHEVGHHVQTLLGTSAKVRQLQQGQPQAEANELSVALELQADFYAGVWSRYNQEYLEQGDIEIALSAANAVGDDAIQKRTQGRVTPDSFTHGTSKQRMDWFMRGYRTGDLREGDTFSEIVD
ncbi:MAG: neutral zinc metallopeptidase [Salinimicrobium sp.]